jgi:O-acetyl-ADP-ribose deacetylase (regulator of RNase III)
MKLYLRDRNEALTKEWEKYFEEEEDVHVSCGDIFAPGEHMGVDAIVSPANSFGFMDGGIDYIYSEFFGWRMSDELRVLIHQNHYGELLVGDAQVVDIRNTKSNTPIPYLICAPTMRTPVDVSKTVNAYLALRGTLREAKKHEINSILCPGLGTAVGRMPYDKCAVQMYEAWIQRDRYRVFDVLGNAHMRHHMMMSPQAWSK